MNIPRRILPFFVLPLLLSAQKLSAQSSSSSDSRARTYSATLDRIERHQSPDWLLVEPHLPDPATASPERLMVAGDVLRARRMPEDALDYYNYALARGGNEATLRNRLGVTQLELHQPELARIAFNRVLKIDPRNAAAWNNLGATEYLAGDYRSAIGHYKHALKFRHNSAVYHSNLGTAYFEVSDYESARSQFAAAIKLDPTIFDQAGWSGLQAHVLSPHDRGRFCVEMARLAALNHDDAGVLRWLNLAVSTNTDSIATMLRDPAFTTYRKDPRVLLVLENARTLRNRQIANGPVPPLPEIENAASTGR